MDRVTDFESGGWGFDSLWGRFEITGGIAIGSARFVFLRRNSFPKGKTDGPVNSVRLLFIFPYFFLEAALGFAVGFFSGSLSGSWVCRYLA